MANNRLYLKDAATGETLMVAKSFGDGWSWRAQPDAIEEWLSGRDHAAAYGNTTTAPSQIVLVTENEAQ